MMDYTMFKELVNDRFMDYMPEEYKKGRVSINKVNKINGSKDGLSIYQENDKGAPTIYVDDMYEKRMQEGWYDCSSLVYRLYKEAGLVLSGTAAEQGEDCYKKAQIINKKDLKPGDLIFYSYEENGRFRNISHVAIYVGDGKMVHAANTSRGVVLDLLRTGSVVFYARPYR